MTDTMVQLSNELDMTPEEFRAWHARLGLTDTELARRLDVDQPRIGKWRRGEIKASGYLWRALEHLEVELQKERKPKRRQQQAAGREETGG